MEEVSTINELKAAVERRINAALDKDIPEYLIQRIKEHQRTDVLRTYRPVEYKRRKDGLGNDDNFKVKRTKNSVTVMDVTRVEGPRLTEYNPQSETDLAKIIESGAYNPWNNNSYVWTGPRPYMTNTQNYINEHPKTIKTLILRQFR